MAIDTVESPSASPSSPSISHFSPQRHFYVAVDRHHYKMVTLLELLGMAAGSRPGLPIVVSCSSRDELDAVCSAVSSLSFISLASLYSDLAEAERASVLEKFRQATVRWNQNASAEAGEDTDSGKDEQKSYMIVVTDACLPLLSSGESPIAAHVLINYELPTKKETYMRRMTTCLATGFPPLLYYFVRCRWYVILRCCNNFDKTYRWDRNQYGSWWGSSNSQKH